MPFKSQAQLKYMFAKHPLIANKWAKEFPVKFKSLPKRVKKTKKKNARRK